MSVLERISQKEIYYWRYKDRERALREERTFAHMYSDMEETARVERENARVERERTEALQQQVDNLKEMLRARGVDPDLP